MTDDDPKVERLVQKGRKLEAIQRLRERTGMGLAEATAEVERIEMRATAVWAPSKFAAAAAPQRGLDGDIRLLAQRGNRIGAIKLLRERRKLGLKEAKDLLDVEVPPPPTSLKKWIGVALLIGAFVAGVAWLISGSSPICGRAGTRSPLLSWCCRSTSRMQEGDRGP
ncbi:hypothetical protein AAG565_14885, partial [Fontimonas sp. SYSU GA230001]|uniref:hypothetical protein n=1 Tax=Fontimonas sp. SYSU GA230001 TaxID=3142450 RepID=UPI0032B35A91